jgi:4-hydroxythreonine-4-phosphate dehydrogenase
MGTNLENENTIKIGISTGDLNGIGPEVIIKTFLDNRMLQSCTPIIYCSSKVISFHRKALGISEFNVNTIREADLALEKKINLIQPWEEEVQLDLGKPDANSALYAFKSLEAATLDLANGHIDALVTGPIDKHTMQDAGFNFPGHTEYLAEKLQAKSHLMFMVSNAMRVGMVTGHIPIKDVASKLTIEGIFSKIKIMQESLIKDFGIRKPKIAVLGLNPHAGDHGTLGSEDTEIIVPAVKMAMDNNILAFGPYSADGFFGSSTFKQFDGIIAMYHDQGLVPFKAMAFTSGVNFTAGLPAIRTSPDHGTAYELAGKNLASEASFREAVYLAIDTHAKRVEYTQLTSNPLKISVLSKDY